MSPAPLPPHERPWRHPSELAPTKASLEPERHRSALPLLMGTMATVVVVAMVVAMTPSPPSEPLLLSDTTTPARITPANGQDPDAQDAGGQGAGAVGQSSQAGTMLRIASFTAIPNAVSAAPTFTVDGRRYARRLPHAGEAVIVQTESATYRILWREIEMLRVEGRALIADETLALVGYIEGPDFYPLVER